MPTANFDLDALYTALNAQRLERGLTWAQAMREISRFSAQMPSTRPVSRSTVEGLRTRSVVEADGVLQMLRWLGHPPERFVPGCLTTGADALPDIATTQVLRFDTAGLYGAIEAERTRRGLTWTQVAAEIGGIAASSLTHLQKGGRTTFPAVMRITKWLQQPAARFMRGTPW